MKPSSGLRSRVQRLEDKTADSSVVGVVTKRGESIDDAEHERIRRRVEELRRAGRTVYIANLARW